MESFCTLLDLKCEHVTTPTLTMNWHVVIKGNKISE